jgi:hypothetical protein
MTTAFLIHAFKNPVQLARLVRALAGDGVVLFIHVDLASDIRHFEREVQRTNAGGVRWVKRENSRWGSIGTVRAVVNGLDAIEQDENDVAYAYLLSGQDYPIKSNRQIHSFLESNKDKTFISYSQLPIQSWTGNGGYDRLTKYHCQFVRNRRIRGLINRGLRVLTPLLAPREQPANLMPFGGEFYFGLSRPAVDYVVRFVRENPGFLRFHRHTYAPEELCFQTILLNCKDEQIRGNIENRTLTYVDWRKPSKSYPALLTRDDLPRLRESPCLFARKFDADKHPEIFDLVDSMRNAESSGDALDDG